MNTPNKEFEAKKIPDWLACSIPIITLVLGLTGGRLLYYLLDPQSTGQLLFAGFTIAALLSLAGWAFIETAIIRRKSVEYSTKDGIYLARLALISLVFFFLMYIGMAVDAMKAKWADKIAIQAAVYAQENFDKIDRNQDGNILEEEIDYFRSTTTLSELDMEKLAFLTWDFQKIGHILDQHLIGKSTQTTYAINKGDLMIYKADYKPRSKKY
jgi:hypothetical protein